MGWHSRSSSPILKSVVSIGPQHSGRTCHTPGFRALQSAHLSLPATDLIRSCRARSLRACWRLFRAEVMLGGGWADRRRCGGGTDAILEIGKQTSGHAKPRGKACQRVHAEKAGKRAKGEKSAFRCVQRAAA